jgi:antitoxin component of MazEF toxin-antitoxin module
MKFLRRLSRHGGSTHVSIPPQVIDWLRWRTGDCVVVEVRDRREMVIHLPMSADDLRAQMPSMTLDATLPDTQ